MNVAYKYNCLHFHIRDKNDYKNIYPNNYFLIHEIKCLYLQNMINYLELNNDYLNSYKYQNLITYFKSIYLHL